MVCSAGGFGQELRRVRLHCHLTGVELAALLDVSSQYVSMLEHGKSAPSMSMIALLSHALHLGAVDEYRLLAAALADARALLGLGQRRG